VVLVTHGKLTDSEADGEPRENEDYYYKLMIRRVITVTKYTGQQALLGMGTTVSSRRVQGIRLGMLTRTNSLLSP
jgi:hypothetical protein